MPLKWISPPVSRFESDEWIVEGWLRLDNHSELIERLGLSKNSPPLANTELLLAVWKKWGTGCAAKLLGDFSFAITDRQAQIVYLARDPMGVKPMYYRQVHGSLQYAFSANAFSFGQPWEAKPDMDWAARYLIELSRDSVQTAYQGVKKLPPGHWLYVCPQGYKIERYFNFTDDAPPARHRQSMWVEAYREILEKSIRCRMPLHDSMAAENSGGIDSATITAYLAKFLGTPGDRLHSMGCALTELEPGYILETSQAAGITHNYIVTSQGHDVSHNTLANELAVLGYPKEHQNAVAQTLFYKECQRRGIPILFSGFGGDEVVTNPANLIRHELLDAGDYKNLWDILPGHLFSKMARLVKVMTTERQSSEFRPEFLQAWQARWPYQLLRPHIIERLNLQSAYMETARYDAPFRRLNDFILQHHLTRMDVTTRLENCTLLAASYGVDYRWPLWDVRLVQQYLSTPSIEKYGPKGMGRYLHRRAISEVVPRRVAWKVSKNMGINSAFARYRDIRLASNIAQARQHLAYLHPALHELVDREKLQSLITYALQGKSDKEFEFTFNRNISALQRINLWLNKGEILG